MAEDYQSLIEEIAALPGDWHGAGTVGANVLQAIARHCAPIGEIRHTAETGAGRTTLLFSHLSPRHVVFAIDAGDSISQTKASSLFRADSVTFVDGPTQVTLPAYEFGAPFQVVMIDGPHGYPFPDLEYFYFYPHLEEGGLLILDDTRIPSIGRMLEILQADDTFELLEVVSDTAFLRRTGAPTVDPHSDSWWIQGYNRAYYEKTFLSEPVESPARKPAAGNPAVRSALRWLSKSTPRVIKNALPERIKEKLWRKM